MAKQKAIQGQTIIYEIQCRNMKIEKRESPKTGVNFGAHEGKSVPVPLVSSVIYFRGHVNSRIFTLEYEHTNDEFCISWFDTPELCL
jgi:hypothetical protein